MPTDFLTKDLSASAEEHEPLENGPAADFTPYMVQSLADAIRGLLSENLLRRALSEDELAFLLRFEAISEQAKLLAMRIFGRAQIIFREADFDKILGIKSESCVHELVASGLLTTNLDGLEYTDLLNCLNRRELELVALKYNVKNCKKLKMTKLVEILLKTVVASPLGTLFQKPVDSGVHFRKLVSRVLGAYWRTDRSRMRLLASVLWLTSLGSETGSSTLNTSVRVKSIEMHLKSELYNMLLVRRGDLVFPAYEIKRCTPVYRSPNEVQDHLDLLDLELRLNYLLSVKDYSSAMDLFSRMQTRLLDLVIKHEYKREDVPAFLRRFTGPYRALRILSTVVDLFERQRRYKDAVSLILSILSAPRHTASTGCPLDALGPCRAGWLLIRLMIDLGNHLKNPSSAVYTVVTFINSVRESATDCDVSLCPCLRGGLRLSVYEQLLKLAGCVNEAGKSDEVNATREPKRKRLIKDLGNTTEECALQNSQAQIVVPRLVAHLKQSPEVHLTAPVNASSKEIGTSRPHYLWTEAVPLKKSAGSSTQSSTTVDLSEESQTLLLNVEQWVLCHYRHISGFERGIHTESSVYHLLFVLLFYDILFDQSFPDVFYSFRQSAPLDLFTDDFYHARHKLIEQRLTWILDAEKVDQASVSFLL
ncbi:Fanconi-associated nuclease 1 [Paragonimus westermani]|uniref:Fanconi-associated nuclease n=1 Tax=Paragonimus westermani TaxID=34504 RepID=A0A8T0DVM7_9TREM|nr:Fanconi-associated nuclease 1 [Paragonimus westermani]